jgi:hypothetical protein
MILTVLYLRHNLTPGVMLPKPHEEGVPRLSVFASALNHATNMISKLQQELRRRLHATAISLTLLSNFGSLSESFLGKYRRFESLS